MVRLKVLVVLGGGGHTRELLELIPFFDCEFVVCSKDKMTSGKLPHSRIYSVRNLRRMDESFFSSILNILPSFLSAIHVMRKTRANAIITTGPAIAIPFIVLGKIFRKRVIFIETLSRVYTRSLTGKFIHPFSDIFFVQWPELKRKYSGSIYAGRLM